MGNIDRIDAAIGDLTAAETLLDELAAVYRLECLTTTIRHQLVLIALRTHTATEVGRALGGISRQAVNKRYRNTTAPEAAEPPAR